LASPLSIGTAPVNQCFTYGRANNFPGIFSGGYSYWSVGGQTYGQANLAHHFSAQIERWTSLTTYARADFNNFSQAGAPFGFVTSYLRFGGHLTREITNNMDLVLTGGYDATRREGTWHSGGRVGLKGVSGIGSNAFASLGVMGYFDSAGDQLVFASNPSGVEVVGTYGQQFWFNGPVFVVNCHGYEFGGGTTQYGWRVDGYLSTPRGLLTLNGLAGHDGLNGNYYSVGAFVNLGFNIGM